MREFLRRGPQGNRQRAISTSAPAHPAPAETGIPASAASRNNSRVASEGDLGDEQDIAGAELRPGGGGLAVSRRTRSIISCKAGPRSIRASRIWFGDLLLRALGRHSDYRVTQRYVHTDHDALAAAVEELPSLSVPRQLPATGTDGQALALPLSLAADEACGQVTSVDESTSVQSAALKAAIGMELMATDDNCGDMSQGWVTGFEPATFRSTV
jgi:hypothetical protein